MLLSKDGTRLVMGTTLIPSDLTIPASVTVIGEQAFCHNLKLRSVYIPSGVLVVEGYAFYDAQNMEKIYMEDGCTTIGTYAFGYAGNSGNVKELRLSDRITHIGEGAFRASIDLKYIRLPADLQTLDVPIVTLPCAFYVPEGVTYIADQQVSLDVYGKAGTYAQAFAEQYGNDFIESEPFDTFNTDYSYYDWEDGICLNYYAGNETEIVIPAKINGRIVRSIYMLFDGNDRITSVTLPDTLVDIGYYCFAHCSSLTTINFPESLRSIGEHAFYCCGSMTCDVILPEGFQTMGYGAFEFSGIRRVSLPSTLKALPGYAFSCCENLTEAVIAQGLEQLGDCAFSNCTALADMVLPEGLTTIGSMALLRNPISPFAIPSTVTSVGSSFVEDGRTIICDLASQGPMLTKAANVPLCSRDNPDYEVQLDWSYDPVT